MSMNFAERVREFAMAAGQTCPNAPRRMSRDAVRFACKMIIDELMELYGTISFTNEESRRALKDLVDKSPDTHVGPKADDVEACADQIDALVDVTYYATYSACLHGMNASRVFDLVHFANMSKRDPQTGTFRRREDDGKILKPKDWTPPNVRAEIVRQLTDGAWEFTTHHHHGERDHVSTAVRARSSHTRSNARDRNPDDEHDASRDDEHVDEDPRNEIVLRLDSSRD